MLSLKLCKEHFYSVTCKTHLITPDNELNILIHGTFLCQRIGLYGSNKLVNTVRFLANAVEVITVITVMFLISIYRTSVSLTCISVTNPMLSVT